MSFHFFLSATNSLHLLTPSTWRSLSTFPFHPFLGLPLLLVPSSSWVKIFLGILSSSILSRWRNQLILCPFIHFPIFSPLLISSSSRFVWLFHSPFSYLGPYILLILFEYISSKLGLQIIVLEIQQYQWKWGSVELRSCVSASYNQLRNLLSGWTGQNWARCLVNSDGKWGWRCSGKQTSTFLQIAAMNWGECTMSLKCDTFDVRWQCCCIVMPSCIVVLLCVLL